MKSLSSLTGLVMASALVLSSTFAQAGANSAAQARMLNQLQQNTVVRAAEAQIRADVGGQCRAYITKMDEATQFEPGTVYDVEMTFSCHHGQGEGESDGILRVNGRIFGNSFVQDIDVQIRFAG